MSYIETHSLEHSTVFGIYAEREEIEVNPKYQRNGDIWTLEKKQLLIDSIINRYDIPKLYFHKFSKGMARAKGKTFAIIDGRQRLETIWKFIDGEFALKDDFVYLKDSKVNAKGFTYNDLSHKYPKIKNRFDSTSLPIISVETDDDELIDDMFSRLNEASPLNSAEKRNAIGGDVVDAVNKITKKKFFVKKVGFSNRRYQHKEVAIRILFLQHCYESEPRLYDTKKVYLDQFAMSYKVGEKKYISKIATACINFLTEFEDIFIDNDPLLRSQSSVPIYCLAYQKLKKDRPKLKFTREKLMDFNRRRELNRAAAEQDMTSADFDLLEYDRMSQQGTNDASSIRDRVKILCENL